jgi:hypothetical protein
VRAVARSARASSLRSSSDARVTHDGQHTADNKGNWGRAKRTQ